MVPLDDNVLEFVENHLLFLLPGCLENLDHGTHISAHRYFYRLSILANLGDYLLYVLLPQLARDMSSNGHSNGVLVVPEIRDLGSNVTCLYLYFIIMILLFISGFSRISSNQKHGRPKTK